MQISFFLKIPEKLDIKLQISEKFPHNINTPEISIFS